MSRIKQILLCIFLMTPLLQATPRGLDILSAARSGNIDLVRQLLDTSTEEDVNTNKTMTPLFSAVSEAGCLQEESPAETELFQAYLDIAQLLLDHGARVNIGSGPNSCTPFAAATEGNLVPMLNILLPYADVVTINKVTPILYITALINAAQTSNVELTVALLAGGANPLIQHPYNEKTAGDFAQEILDQCYNLEESNDKINAAQQVVDILRTAEAEQARIVAEQAAIAQSAETMRQLISNWKQEFEMKEQCVDLYFMPLKQNKNDQNT